MSLRARLIVSFVGLLAALAGLGAWSAWRLWEMGAVSNRIIAQNYDSVVAAQQMKESLERQDSALLFALLDRQPRAQEQLREHRARFAAALTVARGNLTEPGEADIVDAITRGLSRYIEVTDQLAKPAASEPTARSAAYFRAAEPLFNTLRADCDRLLTLNQEAMRRKSAEAAAISRRNFVTATLLAAALTLAGVLVAYASSASILKPITELTRATTELAADKLDVVVPVERSDELGRLATAFNQMAGRLREVRASETGALLAARQMAEAAVDSLYDPVIVTDASGRITRFNDAAETIFGREADARGRHLADVATDARVAAAVDEVLRSQRTVAREGAAATLTLDVRGAERSFRVRSTPMADQQGRLLGAVLLLEDVTHLHEIDRLKSEFVAAASHELRTPLTSLQMGVHLMLEDTSNLTDRQQEILYLCRDEGERLARLARELLDLSRIEAGETPPRLTSVAAGALVRGAVEPLRLQVEAKGIALALDVAPDLDHVLADRGQIERVLANLLTNAARATASGGTIAVKAERRAGQVAIAVTDTGTGIPPEYLRRIFEPFTQVPGVPAGGAGLGLAISRRIIEAHGGQMTVHSTVGEGSAFTFTLPSAA
jgi:two-component system, NtrC family, sensor histidine kinase KinB